MERIEFDQFYLKKLKKTDMLAHILSWGQLALALRVQMATMGIATKKTIWDNNVALFVENGTFKTYQVF